MTRITASFWKGILYPLSYGGGVSHAIINNHFSTIVIPKTMMRSSNDVCMHHYSVSRLALAFVV